MNPLDAANSIQLARLARAHPDADPMELVRLALAEDDTELAGLEATRDEVHRRKAIIRRTGRPTGLPPITLPDAS